MYVILYVYLYIQLIAVSYIVLSARAKYLVGDKPWSEVRGNTVAACVNQRRVGLQTLIYKYDYLT